MVRAGVVVAGLAGAIGAAGWSAIHRAVARIEANPDPYPRELLARELEGEEVLIDRPDGTVLRAISAGEGPAVVLAHGFGVTADEWNLVWDALVERGRRVIAFDQRGHGRSTLGSDGSGSAAMAGDYVAVLEHFDVHDGVLVGHSMGGFVAIRAVLDHPSLAQRLRGLVLFATWAGRIQDGAPLNRLQMPLLKSGLLQKLARTKTIGTLFGAVQSGTRPSPAMISVFQEIFVQQHHQALLPIAQAFAAEDRYPRLGEIQVPTTVIVGAADRTTPRGHAERLAAGVPGARLITVPEAGHLLNWEAEGPAVLLETIGSFQPKSESLETHGS